jgi:hypothetical protein
MDGFGRATVKGEGMVANPDEFVWECVCQECKDKYDAWRKAFNTQQDAFYLASDPTGFRKKEPQ